MTAEKFPLGIYERRAHVIQLCVRTTSELLDPIWCAAVAGSVQVTISLLLIPIQERAHPVHRDSRTRSNPPNNCKRNRANHTHTAYTVLHTSEPTVATWLTKRNLTWVWFSFIYSSPDFPLKSSSFLFRNEYAHRHDKWPAKVRRCRLVACTVRKRSKEKTQEVNSECLVKKCIYHVAGFHVVVFIVSI